MIMLLSYKSTNMEEMPLPFQREMDKSMMVYAGNGRVIPRKQK